MLHQESWTVATRGRGTVEVTADLDRFVRKAGATAGLCHLFLHHTSASLILCENADPSVRRDLERYFARLVPDGDPLFEHTLEGDDDMPAHVRSILTQNSLAIPVSGGRLDLGTWQGVYVWEHRAAPHRRRLTATLLSA
jgi:secondary thiamine-phosphate synthase enzyme